MLPVQFTEISAGSKFQRLFEFDYSFTLCFEFVAGVNEAQTASLGHVPEAGPDAKPNPKAMPDPDARPDPISETHSTEFMRDMIPPTVDFIVSYATLPYNAAFRDPNQGGFYVQALCKFLKQDLEIDVALRRVNQEVRKRWNEIGAKQDPFHIIMPPQRFLFLMPY